MSRADGSSPNENNLLLESFERHLILGLFITPFRIVCILIVMTPDNGTDWFWLLQHWQIRKKLFNPKIQGKKKNKISQNRRNGEGKEDN